MKEETIQTGLRIEQSLIELADDAKKHFDVAKQKVEEQGLLNFAKAEGQKALSLTKKVKFLCVSVALTTFRV